MSSNPNTSFSYWAMHTTHVVVSAIIFGALVALSLIDMYALIWGHATLLTGVDLAGVWIVVGSTGGYFVSRLSITQSGLSEITSVPGKPTST